MDDASKLKRICQKCFREEEWEWLMQQSNFLKLLKDMKTVEDFEAICLVAENLLLTRMGYDPGDLLRRLQGGREESRQS